VTDLVYIIDHARHKQSLKYIKNIFEITRISHDKYFVKPLFKSSGGETYVHVTSLKKYDYSHLYELIPLELRTLLGEVPSPEQIRELAESQQLPHDLDPTRLMMSPEHVRLRDRLAPRDHDSIPAISLGYDSEVETDSTRETWIKDLQSDPPDDRSENGSVDAYHLSEASDIQQITDESNGESDHEEHPLGWDDYDIQNNEPFPSPGPISRSMSVSDLDLSPILTSSKNRRVSYHPLPESFRDSDSYVPSRSRSVIIPTPKVNLDFPFIPVRMKPSDSLFDPAFDHLYNLIFKKDIAPHVKEAIDKTRLPPKVGSFPRSLRSKFGKMIKPLKPLSVGLNKLIKKITNPISSGFQLLELNIFSRPKRTRKPVTRLNL